MPIKPENKARYPANWKAIRAATLERAGYRCEWAGCGVANRTIGFWNAGVFTKLADSRDDADFSVDSVTIDGEKVIEIVLTIAHLDHTPENNEPFNLAAMCQRHHLAYDQAHHTTNAYMTRKARMQTLELPL